MSFAPYYKQSLLNSSITTSPHQLDDKHSKLIEKFVSDLETLVGKLTALQKTNNSTTESINDDCIELQKFCFKLEFLLQFKLKEKKSIFETSLAVPSGNESNLISTYSSRDYWSFLVDVFKSSRGFQDAIKFVKNLSELKTNLGRGRAFIRFCLQYHRLADAIQQLMMEEKTVR